MLIFPKQAFFSWLYSPKPTFFVPEGEAAMEKQSLKWQEERIILHARFTKNRSTSAKKRKQIWNELVSDKKTSRLLSDLLLLSFLPSVFLIFPTAGIYRWKPLRRPELTNTGGVRQKVPRNKIASLVYQFHPETVCTGYYRPVQNGIQILVFNP